MSHARWKTARSTREGVSEEYDELYDDARLADELAQKVYDRRIELGLSQTQLAERAGMKQPQISRLEGGGTLPTLPLLRRLAKALDLELQVGFASPADPEVDEPRTPQAAFAARVAELLGSVHGVTSPTLLRESVIREQLAQLSARSQPVDVDVVGAALVQLKVARLANRHTASLKRGVEGVRPSIHESLERIRTLVDAAVNEAEEEVRRLEDAR